jgi:hypothetical protein
MACTRVSGLWDYGEPREIRPTVTLPQRGRDHLCEDEVIIPGTVSLLAMVM